MATVAQYIRTFIHNVETSVTKPHPSILLSLCISEARRLVCWVELSFCKSCTFQRLHMLDTTTFRDIQYPWQSILNISKTRRSITWMMLYMIACSNEYMSVAWMIDPQVPSYYGSFPIEYDSLVYVPLRGWNYHYFNVSESRFGSSKTIRNIFIARCLPTYYEYMSITHQDN